jgi:ribonuclease VapC
MSWPAQGSRRGDGPTPGSPGRPGRGDTAAWALPDELLRDLELEIVSHDEEPARIAGDAFLRFGKGRHPARLNCGDCASYALAKKFNLPLLFKGTDFARTDIVPALAPPA